MHDHWKVGSVSHIMVHGMWASMLGLQHTHTSILELQSILFDSINVGKVKKKLNRCLIELGILTVKL